MRVFNSPVIAWINLSLALHLSWRLFNANFNPDIVCPNAEACLTNGFAPPPTPWVAVICTHQFINFASGNSSGYQRIRLLRAQTILPLEKCGNNTNECSTFYCVRKCPPSLKGIMPKLGFFCRQEISHRCTCSNRIQEDVEMLDDTGKKRPTLDRMFASTSQRNDDGLRASYNISLLIAKSGKPHTIGEKLILTAVEEVLKTVLHKPASDIIKRIPLSNNTVERRIDEVSSDIESFLCNYLQTTHFSIQLDESTLPDNAALLLAYVRFIMNQEIYEELLFARTLITDTKAESIFHVLKDYLIEKAIPLSNIISVATDGAPAMVLTAQSDRYTR
ncbi:unnamed protein product [Acanthoscelides obtectus]|uniref:DUF4371 domain-containing protein n=1 Tax=Acanthoscelides obtectus TaxID=200917 RepID=A0A9P0P057_ACAOB|nr:unnamed protein product [Acanthoscelides obtectus]CAK1668966.1 SCAN domain-containing protein 3 [Acanthoscelides obtectus]